MVVEQKNMIKFLKYMPRIPFEELAWPSRTVELYLDYPRLPTILAGCFSSEDFENMGIKGVPTRDTATHILIQENESPVSIQAYYSPEDMNTMVRTHPDKLGNEDGGLSSREDTLMKLSATFVYRALELFNLGKFCSYGPLAKVPWRPHRRNRPHTLTRALSNDFDKEDGDVS